MLKDELDRATGPMDDDLLSAVLREARGRWAALRELDTFGLEVEAAIRKRVEVVGGLNWYRLVGDRTEESMEDAVVKHLHAATKARNFHTREGLAAKGVTSGRVQTLATLPGGRGGLFAVGGVQIKMMAYVERAITLVVVFD